MNRTSRAALIFALLLVCCARDARAQQADADEDAGRTRAAADEATPRAPLSELRDKRRALLVVTRSLSIDTSGALRAVLDEIFGDPPRTLPRHDYAYDLIFKRLERYAGEYQSMSVVESMDEAELVVVFKVLKEVRSFAPDEPFVYGEMFVLLTGARGRAEPALVWRSKSDHVTPEDAVKEFVKQLKAVRGER